MVVKCKRAADVNLDIKGSSILTLPAGCVARSDAVRLVATRGIITNLTIQTFDEMPLDVSAILNDTNALVDNLVNVRMVGVSLKASTSTRLLKTGKDLREIIDKACALGQYNTITNQLSTFKDTVTYSGSTIILIIVIIIIIVWKIPAWGYPVTEKK